MLTRRAIPVAAVATTILVAGSGGVVAALTDQDLCPNVSTMSTDCATPAAVATTSGSAGDADGADAVDAAVTLADSARKARKHAPRVRATARVSVGTKARTSSSSSSKAPATAAPKSGSTAPSTTSDPATTAAPAGTSGLTGTSSGTTWGQRLVNPPSEVPKVSPPVDISTCDLKPSAATTGAKGTRTSRSTTTLTDGQTLENANVRSLTISGDNVTVRNVQVAEGILVTGDNVTISHVTTPDIGISSAQHVLVEYTDIGFSKNDAIHVTSDRGRTVTDVTLRYNYLHDPRPPSDAHYDGTQVRGVNGLKISCSVYDAGKYTWQLNAAIYLEDANGGNSNTTIKGNWLYGTGISLFIDPSVNTVVQNNRLGGDIHWGPCYQNSRSRYTSSGNVWDDSGQPINLCGNG